MILFFGPPGSGKSGQSRLLVEHDGWEWLSTGQLLRTSTDPAVINQLKKGDLIDDELVAEVLVRALDKTISNKVILDGYPRTITQAKWLNVHLPDYGKKIEVAIVLEAPEKELKERLLKRNRAEDVPIIFRKRLALYNQNITPILAFYETTNIPIKKVDGQGDIEVVHNRIKDALNTCSLG